MTSSTTARLALFRDSFQRPEFVVISTAQLAQTMQRVLECPSLRVTPLTTVHALYQGVDGTNADKTKWYFLVRADPETGRAVDVGDDDVRQLPSMMMAMASRQDRVRARLFDAAADGTADVVHAASSH